MSVGVMTHHKGFLDGCLWFMVYKQWGDYSTSLVDEDRVAKVNAPTIWQKVFDTVPTA